MPTLTSTVTAPFGILGGTFDPIHIGHLRIAEEVADALALETVRIIPSGIPPHRAPPLFSPTQRLEMCRHSIASNPRFVLDASEVHKTTPSYTVETLERFASENAVFAPQVLILGADAFLGLHTWYRWEEILKLAHIALVARPGFDVAADLPEALSSVFQAHYTMEDPRAAVRATRAGAIVRVSVTALDISATRIRSLLREGKSVRYLIADDALEIARAKKL
jgi:nicotinate-nucleotide adenylyltransferase